MLLAGDSHESARLITDQLEEHVLHGYLPCS